MTHLRSELERLQKAGLQPPESISEHDIDTSCCRKWRLCVCNRRQPPVQTRQCGRRNCGCCGSSRLSQIRSCPVDTAKSERVVCFNMSDKAGRNGEREPGLSIRVMCQTTGRRLSVPARPGAACEAGRRPGQPPQHWGSSKSATLANPRIPGPAPRRRGRKSLKKTMDLTAHRRISWQARRGSWCVSGPFASLL